jgi:Holliday junction resolvase RusA-like endonuclease
MTKLVIVFGSQIPSGKNAIQIACRFGAPVKYPNKRFKAWRTEAEQSIAFQKTKWPVAVRMALPIRVPVRMTVDYCPQDKRVRDVSGMMDAIQHVLESCEIIENDGLIKEVTWTITHPSQGETLKHQLCAVVGLEAL